MFIDYDCLQPAMQRLISWLNDMKRTFGSGDAASAVKIHGLSEVPLGAGIPHASAVAGAMMASLAACLILDSSKVEAKQLSDCCQSRGSPFEDLFRLSWRLTLELQSGYSLLNGADAFCALVPSSYPLVYMSEPRVIAPRDSAIRRAALYPSPNSYEEVNKAHYWGWHIADLVESAPPWHWPFDFGLIDTGLPKRTLDAVQASLALPFLMQDFASWYRIKLAPRLPSDRQHFLTSRTSPSQLSAKIWQTQLQPAAVMSLRMLYTLVNMLEHGFREDRIVLLATDINKYQYYLNSLGLCDREVDDVAHELRKALPPAVRDRVGVKLTGTGKGGGLVFAGPTGALRDLLGPFVKELHSGGLHSAVVEYASWLDGYEQNGLRIEQCVREQLLSASLGSEYIKAVSLEGNGKPKTRFISEVDIPLLVDSYDLVALVRTKRLYIAGDQIKGKDGLHSATYTAKLLSSLLNSSQLKLQSRQFPTGHSYSNESFELQGKIVGPLKRIVQQRTGKTLNLKVSTTQKKVYLELAPSAVTICVVDN